MKEYKNKGYFRFWANKVLPLIYDDSLSYYEILCKVVDYLNNTIENVMAVEENTTALTTAVNELKTYVENYFKNLDVTEEINAKLDQMSADGTLSAIVARVANYRINLSAVVGTLTSDNFAEAISSALEASRYIYVPAGEYTIAGIEIEGDADIVFAPDAIINYKVEDPLKESIFKFTNGNVSIRGGLFRCLDPIADKRLLTTSGSRGLLDFVECDHVDVRYIVSDRSRFPSVVQVTNCGHVTVDHCSFSNFLLSAVHGLYYQKSLEVTNCTFVKAMIPYTTDDSYYYCYDVYTGAKSLSDSFTPPDNILYEGNYCEDSEDSCLDTHGARNVIIRNNTIIKCNTAITAYNDSERVQRPEGWIMQNVVIENNHCESNIVNRYGKHPFVIVANFRSLNVDLDCNNLRVVNNYFRSKNNNTTYQGCLMLVRRWRNVFVQGNTFDGMKQVNYCVGALGVPNIDISKNTMTGYVERAIYANSARGSVADNLYDSLLINRPGSTLYYFKGATDADILTYPLIALGDVIFDDDTVYMSVTPKLALNPKYTTSFNVNMHGNLADGVLTLTTGSLLIPGMRIRIGNNNAYVTDWINGKKYKVHSYVDILDGEYDVTAQTAVLSEI